MLGLKHPKHPILTLRIGRLCGVNNNINNNNTSNSSSSSSSSGSSTTTTTNNNNNVNTHSKTTHHNNKLYVLALYGSRSHAATPIQAAARAACNPAGPAVSCHNINSNKKTHRIEGLTNIQIEGLTNFKLRLR